MSRKINLTSKLIGNMAFSTIIDGHTIITDADRETGGNNLGPRPKALLLSSLVGCMGYNIMLIIDKMKITIDDLQVDIQAEADKEAEAYEYINLIWEFKGKNLPVDKLKHAVKLSHEKYCGVSAMLNPQVTVYIEVIVKDK